MAKLRTHNDGTNLIVNYLPQTVGEEELSSMFSECGMIDNVRLMRDGKTQISRGFAFVKYVNKDDADKAIKQFTGFKMGRKTLRVSLSRPAGEETRDANLLIENLPSSMTEDELKETFTVYGTLITHRLLVDAMGNSKGKAYIRFNTKAEAEDAIIGMNGIALGNEKPLLVKFAEPAQVNPTPELLKQRSARTSSQPYPLHTRPAAHRDPYHRPPLGPDRDPYSQRPGCDPYNQRLGPDRDPYSQRMRPDPYALPNRGPDLARDPYSPHPSATHPDIDPYATESYSPPEKVAYPPPRRLGQHPGPMERRLPPQQFNHPPINARQPPRQAMRQGMPMPPRAMPMNKPQSEIPVHHHSSYDSEKGWCVFVYNIPEHSTNETLYRLFSRFGAINTVKPVVDENEKCKGYGFVHMMNYSDAASAIQTLDGEEFEGKQLQIRFKNDKK